jgi:hypothetical protein
LILYSIVIGYVFLRFDMMAVRDIFLNATGVGVLALIALVGLRVLAFRRPSRDPLTEASVAWFTFFLSDTLKPYRLDWLSLLVAALSHISLVFYVKQYHGYCRPN